MSIKTTLIAALLGVSAIGAATTASAETRFDANHPRQHEVFSRVTHQERRIIRDRHEGLISRGQAAHLLRAEHRIAREDRTMAFRNGGHISRGEQHALNRQENAVGRRLP